MKLDNFNSIVAGEGIIKDLYPTGRYKNGTPAEYYRYYKELAPKIVCVDGFAVSVQASQTHYCSPRSNYGPYNQVELGFPSGTLGEKFAEYKDGDDRPDMETVFGYVPVDLVRELIISHGGEA